MPERGRTNGRYGVPVFEKLSFVYAAMITESEYLAAKKIVDEYERQQYLERQQTTEDELDFLDDDEWDDGEDDYAIDAATNCICGAWEFMDGQPIHVADCICGAD